MEAMASSSEDVQNADIVYFDEWSGHGVEQKLGLHPSRRHELLAGFHGRQKRTTPRLVLGVNRPEQFSESSYGPAHAGNRGSGEA